MRLPGHTRKIRGIALSPDGNILASMSVDRTIRLWNINTGKLIHSLIGGYKYLSVRFSPDGKTLVSWSELGLVTRLWNTSTGKLIHTFTAPNHKVTRVAFSPDGKTIASGSSRGDIRLWNTNNGKPIRTFNGHTLWVMSLAFSPDGNMLVSGGRDSTLHLWDVKTGKPKLPPIEHTNWVRALAFSPDGNTIASGMGNCPKGRHCLPVGCQNRETQAKTHRTCLAGLIALTFSRRWTYTCSLVASSDGTVLLWEIGTLLNRCWSLHHSVLRCIG